MKSTVNYFFVLILLVSISSCAMKKADPIAEKFAEIESIIYHDPDSAQKLMDKLENTELYTGKHLADYIILQSRFMTPDDERLQSDSLISIAIKYYEENPENAKLARVYLEYCKHLLYIKDKENFLKYSLKAKSHVENTQEYKLKGQIEEMLGTLNQGNGMWEKGLVNFQDALNYYSMVSDSGGIYSAYRNIGISYLYMRQYDSCFHYLTKAKSYTKRKLLNRVILHDLGRYYMMTKNYEKAVEYILESIKLNENQHDLEKGYLALGKVYYAMFKDEDAEKYLTLSLESAEDDVKSEGYKYLYELEKEKGNYKTAIDYKEKSDSLARIREKFQTEKFMASLQERYDKSLDQQKILQEKNKTKTLAIIIIGILFVLVTGTLVFIVVTKDHKNKIKNQRQKLKEIEETVALNNYKISRYQHIVDNLKNKQIGLRENHNQEMAEYKGRISELENQNNELLKNLANANKVASTNVDPEVEEMVTALRLILMKKKNNLKRSFTSDELLVIYRLIDTLYYNFYTRLMKAYPNLTKQNIEICNFIKLGFNNRELAYVCNNKPESVSRYKNRLKKQLNIKSDENLDDFIKTF